MKFKVGDKVRVKDDAELSRVSLKRADFESPYGEIQDYHEGMTRYGVYFEDIFDCWWFKEDMLELVAEETEAKKVVFSPSQVRSAAEFLNLNNKWINEDVEYFEELIYSYIKKAVVSGSRFIGTAGFYALVSEEIDSYFVDILVTPDASVHREYVEAELKDNKLVVEF